MNVPQGRSRRRSNSLPPAPAARLPPMHPSNMGIVIVNGTTPAKMQRPLSGRGSDEAIANEPPRKGHQPSKSGPAPRVSTGHALLTTRGAGVEGSGPSRLPMRLAQAPREKKPLHLDPSSPVANEEPTPRPSDSRLTKRFDTGPRTQLASSLCKNWNRKFWSCEAPEPSFVDCHCQRCSDMSRSVFVARLHVDGISNRQACDILAEYFSRWGHVENCNIRTSNFPAGSFALVRYTSDTSAIKAVAAANGLPLNVRHLTGARVDYPHFSKYFRNMRRQPRIRSSGSPNSPPSGSRKARNCDQRQPRQQLGTPPHRQAQSPSQATRWSPPDAGSIMKTNSYRHGSWAGHQPQNSPPFPPSPPRLHGPFPQAHPVPHLQHGWPEMPMPLPMPSGPLAFYPFPPSLPMYHPHGPEQPDGLHGFPPLPPPPQQQQQQQFESSAPSPHGPRVQHHPRRTQGSPDQAWSPTPRSRPVPAADLGPTCNEQSMQTKPPSDDEVNEGDLLTPVGSSTASAHSSAGSMSIRVRLPGMTTDSEPEECPVLTPSHGGLRRDSPVRQITFGDIHTPVIHVSTATEEPVVLIEDHNRVGEHSPVRRIAFGDFVPPEIQTAPAAEETEITRTPQHATMGKDRADQEPALLVSDKPGPTQATFAWQLEPSSAQRNSGDIRLEPDFNGTVIHRPPRRQRVPWSEDDDDGFSGSWDRNHGAYPAVYGGDEMRHPPHFAPPLMPNGMANGMHSGVHNGMYHRPFNGAPHHPFHEPYWHGPNQAHHPANRPYRQHWNGPYQAPPLGFQTSPPNPSGFHAPPPNPPGFQTSPPKPPPDQSTAVPGASKAKPKKKKAKNKNQSGANSQVTSRSATPLPQAPSGHTAPPNIEQGPPTTSGKALRTKHKASTRPTTPVLPKTGPETARKNVNAINPHPPPRQDQIPGAEEAGKPPRGKHRAPTRPTTPVPPKTGTEDTATNLPVLRQDQLPGTEDTSKPPRRKQHKTSTRPATPVPPKNGNASSMEDNNTNPTTQTQASNAGTGAAESAKPPKGKRKPSTRPPTPIPPPITNGDDNAVQGPEKQAGTSAPLNGGGGFRADAAGGSLRIPRHRRGLAKRVHVRDFFKGME